MIDPYLGLQWGEGGGSGRLAPWLGHRDHSSKKSGQVGLGLVGLGLKISGTWEESFYEHKSPYSTIFTNRTFNVT